MSETPLGEALDDDDMRKMLAISDKLKAYTEDIADSVLPFLGTTLLLMHRIAMGSGSPFAPYVSTFPKSHDCTLCWDDAAMKELKGTAVQHTGRAKSKDVFRRHILPVLEQQPSLWPGADYAAFEHAAGMVQSRSFRLNEENFLTGEAVEGKELYLIPGIDMLNHRTKATEVNSSLQQQEKKVVKQYGGSAEGVYFQGFFAINADKPIKAGEEVVISYGNLSDAQLLQIYGFVEEHEGFTNPWNSVSIPVSTVDQALGSVQPAKQEKSQKRKRQDERAAAPFKITEADPVPESLVVYIAKLAHEGMDGFEAMLSLLSLAGQLMAAYEGSQQGDQDALRSGAAQGRLRAAMLVRVGERHLLRKFKEAVIRLMTGRDKDGNRIYADDEEEGDDEDEDVDEDADEDAVSGGRTDEEGQDEGSIDDDEEAEGEEQASRK
ncbi:hypothetical protein CVIRNUC_005945 [Coccomyxa viridis]|uniref:SET domain-containing protein n=1 Tax=Coccomyxa viridis TaxID=1274662 RepID=A0AAV1I9P0_9CHLO|nr:hypothetical protein CVIRNUC_005945 [Coccomyxa viridis]